MAPSLDYQLINKLVVRAVNIILFEMNIYLFQIGTINKLFTLKNVLTGGVTDGATVSLELTTWRSAVTRGVLSSWVYNDNSTVPNVTTNSR